MKVSSDFTQMHHDCFKAALSGIQPNLMQFSFPQKKENVREGPAAPLGSVTNWGKLCFAGL
jgi:hypothetical protein